VNWEDPPSRRHNRGGRVAHVDEVAELRAHPGRWAVLREYPAEQPSRAKGFAYAINHGVKASFRPSGEFEATWRTDAGRIKVYVRYVGESS
jgi:hypothetical protein